MMVMVPSTTPLFSHVFPMDKVFAHQCAFYSAELLIAVGGILDMPIHPQDWLLLWKQVAQSATTVKTSNNWYRQNLKNHKDHIWTRTILHFIFLVKLGHPLEMTQHQDKSTIIGGIPLWPCFSAVPDVHCPSPVDHTLEQERQYCHLPISRLVEKLLHC